MIGVVFIILINFFINPNNCIKLNSTRRANNTSVDTFNHLMIRIEDDVRYKRYKKLCINSIKVKNLIESNLTKLKEEEPTYGWGEMKTLMNSLQQQLCKK